MRNFNTKQMKIRFFLLVFFLGISVASAFAQVKITGTVTDASNQSTIPGVSIAVKGTNAGTMTDINGQYSIEVDGKAVLVFSFIGFTTLEIPVQGKTIIDVSMSSTAQLLDQLIVTGYSSQKKVDVTGAISVVEMKKIASQSLSSGNVMQALQGNVAGLYVTKSGNPSGASDQILIRGVNTLGDTKPLYIIDGVPTTRPEVFAALNPGSIESVQVLKDASASSIYGSRAANGVIIVTTKTSTKNNGKVNLTFNTNLSIQSEKKERYKMLSSLDRGKVLWQACVNDHTDPAAAYGDIYAYSWNGDYTNPVLNSVAVQPFVGGDPNYPAGNTDWQDATYTKGYVTNSDLTLTAGNDNAFVMANFGYLKNTGMLVFTNYDRINGKLNSNFKMFNGKLKFGVNSQFSSSNETGATPDIGSAPTPGLAVSLAPTIPLYGLDGTYGGPIGGGYSDRNNPVLMQDKNQWDNSHNSMIFGNAYAEWKILNNLVFRSSIGMDYNAFKQKNIETKISNGFVSRTTNSLNESTSDYLSMAFTNTLNYNLKFGENNFDILAGTESVETNVKNVSATAYDFAIETEEYFVLGAASGQRTNSGFNTGSSLLSQFGKIGYSYSDLLLASVTLRRDGSSRFGSDTRYGIFPSATVGLRLNNFSFLKDVKQLTNLKVRAGYGEVGNQSIGDLAQFGLYEARYGPSLNAYSAGFFEQYYNIGTAYDINGVNTGTLPSGFVSIQAANAALKWESTREINLGVDFGFLANKLVGSFDYFARTTDNILIKPPIASVLGEGQQKWLNGATKENHGWELSLGYQDETRGGLTYAVSTNFGASKDKITKLPEEVVAGYKGLPGNTILGHSQYEEFGYISDGIFQNADEVAAWPTQIGAAPGRIKYKDLNNDGVVNSLDQDWIGTYLPKLEYGIRINLGYKNFDFSAFGSGVAGRKGVDAYIYYNNFVESRENAAPGTLDAWTTTNSGSDIPAATIVDNNNEKRMSDYLLRNNSYFKLRNLQLGYNVPVDIIKKTGMSQLRVYFQGENLFWITPKGYIGSDPERTSIDRIPVPTSYSFGLSASF
ncbi:MAG: TonB-dependent receptor [Bacteroidales bacterium]|nr:TonB-dependent receptor [Bacteroidales bacterium]